MMAKQRYDAIAIVSLAHQTEAIARIPKRLPRLEDLIKRLQRPRKKVDQSAAVAALLDRLAAKSAKQTEESKES